MSTVNDQVRIEDDGSNDGEGLAKPLTVPPEGGGD